MIKDKLRYRILLIEDNPGDVMIIEDFIGEMIELPGIKYADSFAKANALLTAETAPFDVVLLDLKLTDMSGQQLITAMLKACTLSPIIILTGYADIEFSTRAITQGIYDYLLKDELTAIMLYKSIVYAIERKKNISELERTEKKYSDLFNLSPQPMWVYDPGTYRFIQVNRAATEQYGYTEAEFMQMSILDIRPPEEAVFVRQLVESHNQTKSRAYHGKSLHRKKDGSHIEVDIYSNPILINDKTFRSVIAIDVTEKNLRENAITRAIIKTQEEERYEIGGELHDNVCQLLAASQMGLGMLKKSLPVSRMEFYEGCRNNISKALEEIRNLSHRLAPAFFDEANLDDAFRKLFDSFLFEPGVVLRYHNSRADGAELAMDIQFNLYRIVQEQLKNILKYAAASLIEINLGQSGNHISISISDNGKGFNLANVKKGIGFANIRRRAELFGGNMVIVSAPGKGCRVEVVLQHAG